MTQTVFRPMFYLPPRPVANAQAAAGGCRLARSTAATGDVVRFGAKPANDASKRLKAAMDEAITLFSNPRNRDKARLVEAVQDRFKDSPWELHVYDGSKPGNEWVNDVCGPKGYNVPAFFQVPDLVLYGVPLENPTSEKPFPKNYLQEVIPFLESPPTVPGKRGRVAVYLSKDADLASLQHELFHALQFKHGLPFGTTPEADAEALAFRNRYNAATFSNPVLNNTLGLLVRGGKALLSWLFEVPYALLRHLATGGFRKKPATPTPGEALRLNKKREMEVDKLFIVYGGRFGASMADRLRHLEYFLFEEALQYFRSYRLG